MHEGEDMSYSKLSASDQIHEGDRLIVVDDSGKVKKTTAKIVINPNTDKEEIVINKSKNHYFILSMYLRGASWVKAVAYEPVLNR